MNGNRAEPSVSDKDHHATNTTLADLELDIWSTVYLRTAESFPRDMHVCRVWICNAGLGIFRVGSAVWSHDTEFLVRQRGINT